MITRSAGKWEGSFSSKLTGTAFHLRRLEVIGFPVGRLRRAVQRVCFVAPLALTSISSLRQKTANFLLALGYNRLYHRQKDEISPFASGGMHYGTWESLASWFHGQHAWRHGGGRPANLVRQGSDQRRSGSQDSQTTRRQRSHRHGRDRHWHQPDAPRCQHARAG